MRDVFWSAYSLVLLVSILCSDMDTQIRQWDIFLTAELSSELSKYSEHRTPGVFFVNACCKIPCLEPSVIYYSLICLFFSPIPLRLTGAAERLIIASDI